MEWNASVNAARQAEVAAAFGGAGEPAGQVLRRFVAELGLAHAIAIDGIGEGRSSAIAASWDGTGPIATNPRKLRGKEDLLEILEAAW